MIRLDPTTTQANAMARAAGVSRFAYNWALAEWQRQREAGEKPTARKLQKQFNAIKREKFPWIMESPRDANSRPFSDLGVAFSNYFASCKGTRKGRRVGYPTLRKRGVNDSFYVANDQFTVDVRGKRGVVRLPVIGTVRMMEALRWGGRILSGRVYRKADAWYLAINVEVDARVPNAHLHAAVGVDLGLKTAVVTSHGEESKGPKPLKAALRAMKRANRRLHRRKKGGANRNKARVQLARLHGRIANVRKDFWHKLTTRICRENQTVVIEDLNIDFWKRNRSLARAVLDVAPGFLRSMLEYKAKIYGTTVIVADQHFPSTQRCSGCGHVKTGDDRLTLSDRVYECHACGLVIDRDLNAALNLEQYPWLRGQPRGELGREPETPMDDRPATRRKPGMVVAEVGSGEVLTHAPQGGRSCTISGI